MSNLRVRGVSLGNIWYCISGSKTAFKNSEMMRLQSNAYSPYEQKKLRHDLSVGIEAFEYRK